MVKLILRCPYCGSKSVTRTGHKGRTEQIECSTCKGRKE